jgi:hypothetical protein
MTMSPAVAKRKADDTTSLPAVAEAIAQKREAELALTDRRLKAYREAVTLAADGKPIPATVADSAAVAAHELRLHHDRLARDVGTMKNALSLDRQMAEFEAGSAARNERLHELKQELIAAEKLIREMRAEQHRLSVAGAEWVAWKTRRNELEQENPHLFRPAADLSDAQWQRLRS